MGSSTTTIPKTTSTDETTITTNTSGELEVIYVLKADTSEELANDTTEYTAPAEAGVQLVKQWTFGSNKNGSVIVEADLYAAINGTREFYLYKNGVLEDTKSLTFSTSYRNNEQFAPLDVEDGDTISIRTNIFNSSQTHKIKETRILGVLEKELDAVVTLT